MVKIIDFGLRDYKKILELQRSLFQNLSGSKKKEEKNKGDEYILIGEHFPVITKGRRASDSNILIDTSILNEKGIEVYEIKRGGDVTYHNPGQVIIYPILDLERHKLRVKDYVNLLEESVIQLLGNYGIKGERIEGATGVWIDKGKENERKISAIGIQCGNFCTMHGLSLNVKNDLSGFSVINPCGFLDKGVTSMNLETGSVLDIEKIKMELLHIFLGLVFPFEEVLDLPEKLGSEDEIV